MKTYYLIKTYATGYAGGEKVERFLYFGKSNKLIGYRTESGNHSYTKDDIRNHGYLSYRKALEAGWALKDEERSPGWSIVINIIAEVA